MAKSLIKSCLPIIRKRQTTPLTLVFWEHGSTKTLCDSKKHVAGEIMFECPDQIVCHADSFFIGHPIQSLAMDDYLISGQTYFVLPIERFAYGVLTTSCLSIFNPNLDSEKTRLINYQTLMNFTAPSSPPPFEYSKGLNGKVMIKVSKDFIISLMCNKRNVSKEGEISCGHEFERSAICDSPELKKQYDQLVVTKEHLWSPKLKTISEHEIRVSPLRFLGVNRRQKVT